MAKSAGNTRLVPRGSGIQRVDATILGGNRRILSDLYFLMLRAPWWQLGVVIFTGYVLVNALFAFVYMTTGGIEGAAPGSFTDAFYFSVQTMATIGYGAMHPRTH